LNKSGLRAEVINYGVPAYSTQHEVGKVEQAVREGADLVLLQITLNDAELKPWTPIGITNFSRFGPFQAQGWQKKVFQVWSSLGYVFERFHNTKTHREYVRYFYEVFENPRGWREFGKAVQRINATCQKNNRRLVVVVFPLFGVPLDGKYPFKGLHERIGSFIDSLNLPRLDLLELYQGIPLERIQVIPGEDRHPNEIAHRMAAERIYTWLAENNYIPEELKIRLRFKGRTQIIKEEPL